MANCETKMEPALIVIFILTLVLIIAYSMALFSAAFEFNLKKDKNKALIPALNSISVVIPFRNEASQLQNLFKCLGLLEKEGLTVEFLLVNDHSTDDGGELAKVLLNKSGLHGIVIDLSATELGKKAAVKKGIEFAAHELIATLDADCRPGTMWLTSLLNSMAEKGTVALTGPVRYIGKLKYKGCDAYQQMESAVLMALTQKQTEAGNAIMGNAANMCFTKKAYYDAEVGRKDKGIAGGDDIFLLEAIEMLKLGKIGFAGHAEAVVETDTEGSWSQLFEQRVRWAAKVRFQTKPGGFVWQIAAFIFSLLYAGLVLVCAARVFWLPLITITTAKVLADMLIVSNPLKKMGYRLPWVVQAWTSVMQPFFILAVGCKARFGKFKWKGRLLKA